MVPIQSQTGPSVSSLAPHPRKAPLSERLRETLAILANLKLLGVRLSLDGFGSGYSCLAHLGRFPLDRLKLGRAFMHEIDTGARYALIVRSVTSLCAQLGVVTTAEGIETAPQRDLAKQLGCQELQGYLLGRPLALEELLAAGEGRAKAA